MPRIKDTERVLRLLRTEGGTAGRRDIIEALGITDDRYEEIAGELVELEAVLKNRGRSGGLRLAGAEQDQAEVTEEASPPLERDLYEPFERYLLTAAGDESRSVVLNTHRTHGSKWETPDLAEIRLTPFPMIGKWELRLAVYELKRKDSWSVDSVLQTATYNEFSHESWLVVPGGADGDWTEYFGKRVVDTARDLGIGLSTFDESKGTLKKHTAARLNSPSLSRQQEWLETVLERLGQEKKREDISSHIRWARSKADSGRD